MGRIQTHQGWTTQFSLPVSDSGVRSLLRRRYFEQLDAAAQLEQMDDAHTLPRDEDEES